MFPREQCARKKRRRERTDSDEQARPPGCRPRVAGRSRCVGGRVRRMRGVSADHAQMLARSVLRQRQTRARPFSARELVSRRPSPHAATTPVGSKTNREGRVSPCCTPITRERGHPLTPDAAPTSWPPRPRSKQRCPPTPCPHLDDVYHVVAGRCRIRAHRRRGSWSVSSLRRTWPYRVGRPCGSAAVLMAAGIACPRGVRAVLAAWVVRGTSTASSAAFPLADLSRERHVDVLLRLAAGITMYPPEFRDRLGWAAVWLAATGLLSHRIRRRSAPCCAANGRRAPPPTCEAGAEPTADLAEMLRGSSQNPARFPALKSGIFFSI